MEMRWCDEEEDDARRRNLARRQIIWREVKFMAGRLSRGSWREEAFLARKLILWRETVARILYLLPLRTPKRYSYL